MSTTNTRLVIDSNTCLVFSPSEQCASEEAFPSCSDNLREFLAEKRWEDETYNPWENMGLD